MDRTEISNSGLPAPLSAFIGRDREIGELLRLVSATRLVTVTGAGGSGKTRLALEVARRFAATTNEPVRWVELAPLGRGDLLTQHVAAQLDAQERPDRAVLDALLDALKSVRVLVLDNCEHVIEDCAVLVDHILRHNDTLTVLATSREALGIEGERAWLLHGLAVDAPPENSTGEPGTSGESEAVKFFVERAGAVSASFRLTPANVNAIRHICRRLDGLPLAIELAAARVAVLAPEQIAARLDDVFRLLTTGSRSALPRHRTLRATVDWSYQRLTPMAQILLQRLTVFAGAFSIDAAERVCSDDLVSPDDVLELLAGLVSRSLVVMQEADGTARYVLLEIIRQYAAEQLAEDPQAQRSLPQRHADYYASLAETALPHLERRHSRSWAARLTAEHDNLRAALHWSFETGERTTGLRLAGALWWYWGQTWQWSEAELWLGEAQRGDEPPASEPWGQVLNGAGTFAYLQGDLERARSVLEHAVEVLERAGDRLHAVMSRSSLAHLLCTEGKFETAIEYSEIAAAIARTLDEPWPLCHAMSNGLGHAHTCLGNYDLAEACLREAFEKAERAGGHFWGMAEVARARAALAIERRQPEQAAQHARAAIATVREIQDLHTSIRTLLVVERVLCSLALYAEAARVSGAISASRDVGMTLLPNELRDHDGARDESLRELGDEAFAEQTAEGRKSSVAESLAFAAERLESRSAAGAAPRSDRSIPVTDTESYEFLVRSLGRMEVRADGASPASGSLNHSKAMELLLYLLCHPDGRTREQIGVAFWPDATTMQVKNNFHVLLHKLRKELGRHDIVVAAADRYRINPQVKVWFDAAVFRRDLSVALRARSGRRIEQLAGSLALYEGDFMDGVAVADWSLEMQERLQRLYTDGLSALADLQIEADDLAGASETLQRLIQKDDLREDAWRRWFECLARTGRRDQALVQYGKFAARLRDELDAEPEPATVALARRLAKAVSG